MCCKEQEGGHSGYSGEGKEKSHRKWVQRGSNSLVQILWSLTGIAKNEVTVSWEATGGFGQRSVKGQGWKQGD